MGLSALICTPALHQRDETGSGGTSLWSVELREIHISPGFLRDRQFCFQGALRSCWADVDKHWDSHAAELGLYATPAAAALAADTWRLWKVVEDGPALSFCGEWTCLCLQDKAPKQALITLFWANAVCMHQMFHRNQNVWMWGFLVQRSQSAANRKHRDTSLSVLNSQIIE